MHVAPVRPGNSAPRQLSLARPGSGTPSPIQRVNIKSESGSKSYAELMATPEFALADPVKEYERLFPPPALQTLLDVTWKDTEFHNTKALIAAINKEIRSAKAVKREKRDEEEAPKIEEKRKAYASNTSEEDWAGDWPNFASPFMPLEATLSGIAGRQSAALICFKLTLVSKFRRDIAGEFVRRIVDLGRAKLACLPYDWPGIKATLDMVTAPLPGVPMDYSPFGGEHFDAFFGISKGGGIPLSFEGITSELDAILNVRPDELAHGEVVFSGSNYKDADYEEMTKNVDVSYIDGNGVLHLIENGKDMNTLKNKAVGKHAQKAIYMHLSKDATSLIHTPVAPLTHEQASRNQITRVQWWYAIPPEALNPKALSKAEKLTLFSVAAAGAGLRFGANRLLPEEIFKLCRS